MASCHWAPAAPPWASTKLGSGAGGGGPSKNSVPACLGRKPIWISRAQGRTYSPRTRRPASPLRSFDHRSVHLDPTNVEKLHHHNDEQKRKHGERDCRALAQ